MKPIVKWAGGKEKELPIIFEKLPQKIDRFIEPFVGGGSVFLGLEYKNNYINDKSSELIELYKSIKGEDKDFYQSIDYLYKNFRLIDEFSNNDLLLDLYNETVNLDEFISNNMDLLSEIGELNISIFLNQLRRNIESKIKRSKKLEKQRGNITAEDKIANMESAIKSAYYMLVRDIYNNSNVVGGERSAVFYFIREYCYSSMFRYNKSGKFNVPYGGISYNRKNFKNKIDYIKSNDLHCVLDKTEIYNMDFELFINRICPNSNDFIFLDPPYDTEFSSYSNNKFGQEEQVRLRDCLLRTDAKFMLIIKNTDFIYSLYDKYDFNINTFDKKYLVSFMNRNNKKVKHLMITNY